MFVLYVCTVLTLNRYYSYPTTPAHPVRVRSDSLSWKGIKYVMDREAEKKNETKRIAYERVNQVKCQHTGYENRITQARPGNNRNKETTTPKIIMK